MIAAVKTIILTVLGVEIFDRLRPRLELRRSEGFPGFKSQLVEEVPRLREAVYVVGAIREECAGGEQLVYLANATLSQSEDSIEPW